MSNKNSDAGYDQLSSALEFFFDQHVKRLNTAMPGVVRSYDASTRRARVQPAIRTRMTNGEFRSKPLIVDVPVMHPHANGYIVHVPIQAGTPVMLLFSQRGITEFKQSLAESNPDLESVLALKDAVAFTGFGETADISLANGDELVLQNQDGSTHIRVGSDTVHIDTPNAVNVRSDSTAEIESPEVTIRGNLTVTGTVTSEGQVNAQAGVDVTGTVDASGRITSSTEVRAGTVNLKTHIHTGVSTGGGVSGPPRP